MVSLILILVDAATWIQLDVATSYAFPLVLAALARSRRVVWILTTSLIAVTFAVYAWQLPSGSFSFAEVFFVNRLLGAATLLIIAWLLDDWIRSINASEMQTRLIHEQNQKLLAVEGSRRLAAVQETERRMLSNDLHNLVGQKLTALHIHLNIVKAWLPSGDVPQLVARLDESLTMVEETIQSIRDVMVTLRPAVLDEYGLAAGLRWFGEQFTKRTGVPVQVIEAPGSARLPPAIEEALFRITQEALTNVAKYATASKATVTVGVRSGATTLTVEDDGRGFDPDRTLPANREKGWGLMIMRERAAAVGGSLQVKSAPGHGTRIVVNCPVDAGAGAR